MLEGFKKFILRGNVVDLAVGLVIGAAFAGITTALVEKVINPFIAGLVGQPSFDNVLAFQFGLFGDKATIQFGALLTAIVNFILVAAAIYFLVVAPMNKIAEKRAAKEAAEAPAEAAPTAEEQLLAEIRDLLASQQNK
ncbi:large conductance mechanosensitive channel protein MscL [Gleimia sp. 6138-11-ORH1]|uniref:large conductance mechanosensitive channel protein MscL n=1 Tax=Gleimia sp. 6138-11-ORH1 TaxID=2973937 RepID=UPI00216A1C62|nr:large conductance mechanosensitive channel protein MscL [Gleimia sp. 6138-11-ORH1]MCS4484966.1 large conductance mechanosensitive channel protein MscL [Gleimia sp. 6138-11-ORH1]